MTPSRYSRPGNFLLLALFVASVLAAGRTLCAETVDHAVAAVEQHYQAVTDLTANIVQKNYLKSLEKKQAFEAGLWIKKPGRLRLEYTNGQLIVIDGKAALFYSKKSEQLIKKTFTDFEHMNIPVAFLLGAAHIRDDFDVLQPDPKQPRKLELLPKKAGAAMKKLALTADAEGRIADLTIYDRSGNITEIRFSDVRENTNLDNKLFTFNPPKGTEIIEQ